VALDTTALTIDVSKKSEDVVGAFPFSRLEFETFDL